MIFFRYTRWTRWSMFIITTFFRGKCLWVVWRWWLFFTERRKFSG